MGRFPLSVVFASTIACAAAAQGSGPSGLSFGITAGRSTPAGNTSDFYGSGYQLGGLAELRTPLSWLAVRLNGGYQQLGSSTFQFVDSSGDVTGEGRTTTGLFSGTVSLAIRVPHLQTRVRPYALATVGSYWLHQRASWDGAAPPHSLSSTTRVNGAEAGLGLEAPLAHAVIFAEARYQHVGPGPLRFVPISVGLRLP